MQHTTKWFKKVSHQINDTLAKITEGYPPDEVPVTLQIPSFWKRYPKSKILYRLGIVETAERGYGNGQVPSVPTIYRVTRRSITPEELAELMAQAA